MVTAVFIFLPILVFIRLDLVKLTHGKMDNGVVVPD